MPHKDREVRNAYARKYHQEHKEAIHKKQHLYYREHREKLLGKSKEYGRKMKEANPSYDKIWRDKMKYEVLSHYSKGEPVCAKCGIGDIDVLCLDHINGGGTEHRHREGLIGQKLYRWIRKNNYPEGFQVLCFNCNMKKSFKGDFDKVTMWVRLADDQSMPEYNFTNTPTYFESGYNIAQQDMLEQGWRKVKAKDGN